MNKQLNLWLIFCIVLLLGISTSVSARSAGSMNESATEAAQAGMTTEQLIVFLNPGIDFTLIDFVIPSDLQPEVTFSIADPLGDPIDLFGDPALGEVDIRFMLSYIPVGEENKINYHPRPRPDRGRDYGGEYTTIEVGTYMYKFGTVLPADYETDATHTLASVATQSFRNTEFAEYGLDRYYDNDVYNFVPSGDGEPMPRDIVVTETCNNCHNPLGMHGGRYQQVQVCTQCHNPAYAGAESADELSYDFGPVIHRLHSSNEPEHGTVHFPAEINDCQVCHTGGTPTADLPMVADPNPIPTCDGSGLGMTNIVWGDAGPVAINVGSADGTLFGTAAGAGSAETGKWVRNGMDFVMTDADNGDLLQEMNVDLTVYGCAGNAPYTYGNPEGTVGELHTNWMTRPSRLDCGGCHANINWETGEGHAGGAQDSDDLCSICHAADSGEEFDASVAGAHTVPLASTLLAGMLVEIKEVTNTGPGQRPTVVFSATSKFGPIDPSMADRLMFSLIGPNEDYEFFAQEDVRDGLTAVEGGWSYTFDAKIPMDAEGSYSVAYEGYIFTEVNGSNVRDAAETDVVAVAVTDDEPEARRLIVDDAKCEACHSNLNLHGTFRRNANEHCQTCHAPSATDVNRRPEGEGEPESIHFKYMVHKIHRGAELENLPYIVYGFGNRPHDYSDVHFPGDLRDCESCHLADSYGVPLPDGALPTVSPAAPIPVMGPITATCLSCHDGDSSVSHALANTTAFGESCETCHSDGKSASVDRVHAR